ncbi:GspE/PulE family protein [Vibrio viridaestus]|nr:ATPase, T2SS/T4P/T4SS family [Vibrio viridaestus]
MTHPLLNLLRQEKYLNELQYQHIVDDMSKHSIKAIKALMESEFISLEEILSFLSHRFSLPLISLENYQSDQLLERYSELIHRHYVLPLQETETTIELGVLDPTDVSAEQELSFISGKKIKSVLIRYDEFLNSLTGNHYKISENTLPLYQLDELTDESETATAEKDWEDNTTPVTQLLLKILTSASYHQASDIHFEPFEHHYQIRLRIDGVLTEEFSPSKDMSRKLTAKIKVLANLNIAERRRPQDGRFKVRLSTSQSVDLRVSTIPTLWGEKLVLRMLNTQVSSLKSDKLGMNEQQLKLWKKTLNQPQGLILVTGPTGSGKTFSLYSALSELDHQTKNISTIEDPIEIQLSGINQIQINPKIDLHFSDILRAMLRQDPDVIMLGEIRDSETASMAFRAAQTGHLVLSTLHANSAHDSISRLRQLGIQDYLINSCLTLVIAQRLVRKLCNHCKCPQPIPDNMQMLMTTKSSVRIFTNDPQGCSHCHNGFKGRLGVFELLAFNTDKKPLTCKTDEITLWQSGLNALRNGLTSYGELLRVLEHTDV